MNFIPRSYDFFGSVVLAKFPKESSLKDRKNFAEGIMKNNPGVKTVLEKTGKFKGRLRKQETKFILGEKTKEVLYRENGCVFRFNIDSTYFSPRLSNERKEIASKIKKGDDVLVMFSGVAPFSIVIAKNSKAKKIVSIEINREATKYAKFNVELNKLKNKIEVVQGNVKNFVKKLSSSHHPLHLPQKSKKGNIHTELQGLNKIPKKYDVIVMPRPQLKESFLKEAFSLSKKNTRVFYYDFVLDSEREKIFDKIKAEAKKSRKKIKILGMKNAGEIGKRKFR